MQATKTQTNLRVFAGHTHRKFLDVTTIVQSCRDSSKTDPERGVRKSPFSESCSRERPTLPPTRLRPKPSIYLSIYLSIYEPPINSTSLQNVSLYEGMVCLWDRKRNGSTITGKYSCRKIFEDDLRCYQDIFVHII